MGEPATITGRVQNKSAMGIEQICVEAVTPGQNNQLGSAQTDSSGDYTLSGLPPTTVIVRFQDCGNPRQYLDQFYNGVSDSYDAQQLSLSSGSTVSLGDALRRLPDEVQQLHPVRSGRLGQGRSRGRLANRPVVRH